MALATVSDVKRVLRIPDSETENDAYIESALVTTEESLNRRLRVRYDVSGPQSFSFFDVSSSARLPLPPAFGTVTAVVLGAQPPSIPGTPVGFVIDGDILRLTGDGSEVYHFITVTMTGSGGVVPAGLRHALSLMAAHTYETEGDPGAVVGETIGDYRYQLAEPAKSAGGEVGSTQALANRLLRPYVRKSLGVVVV